MAWWGWAVQRHIAMRWAAVVASGACTLALERADRQCQRHADCRALGSGLVCAEDGVCVPLNVNEPSAAAVADAGSCRAHSECAGSFGQSLCINGACQPLNEPSASCVSWDWGTTSPPDAADVLVVGMLVPSDELAGSLRVTGAVATAVRELNAVRELAPTVGLPAIVAVACDESKPESVAYLVDTLRARIIVGPTRTAQLEPALRKAGEAALLLAPFADGPDLPVLADRAAGRLVSCKPNRSAVRAYFLDAVEEVRAQIAALAAPGMDPIEAALAVSGDEATLAFSGQFNDQELQDAGLRRLRYTADPSGSGLLSALIAATPRPNLVVAASSEDDWAANIAAVDGATYVSTGAYPYYLLGEKSTDVLSMTNANASTAAGFPAPSMRLIGLDYHRDDLVARTYSEFAASFVQAHGAPPAGLEYAYDCAYLGIYSAIAAGIRRGVPPSSLSASEIVLGLDALHGEGAAVPVRAASIREIMARLAARRGESGSVDLIGSSGQLDIEQSATSADGLSSRLFSVAPPAGELYCVDGATLSYCDTGIVFPVAGGEPSRSDDGCTCFLPSE